MGKQVEQKISISAAIRFFGRASDGYGGAAALARFLGITQSAVGRWPGPHVPAAHAGRLARKMQLQKRDGK